MAGRRSQRYIGTGAGKMGVPGRNDPCHCGSAKKYKKCHLDIDRGAERAVREARPVLQQKTAEGAERDRRLRLEHGFDGNLVSPVEFQGRKVVALGSRLYTNRRLNETDHEFYLDVLRSTLGEKWRSAQATLPAQEQHFLMRCFDRLAAFQTRHAQPEKLARDGVVSAEMNGWVRYLLSLAWDVASLINNTSEIPEPLLKRLRNRAEFQGARYEIAVAAIFARLDCSIRFLDEVGGSPGVKHAEFEATHRGTEQTFTVEAKSRRRVGVINEHGEPDVEASMSTDRQSLRRLFNRAVGQAPTDTPFFIFIDINAPPDASMDKRWQDAIKEWFGRRSQPTTEAPEVFNALYVTNFSPHYDGDDISRGGSWLETRPEHVRVPLKEDLWPALHRGLNAYGTVPAFGPDGRLLN